MASLNFSPTPAGVGAVFNSFGGAASDLFAAQGFQHTASADELAATAAKASENSEANITLLKQRQEARAVYQTIGAEKADVGAAGLEQSGSAIDVLRSSAEQGAIASAQIGAAGNLEGQQYEAQFEADTAAAAAARSAEGNSTMGAIVQGISGVASLASLFAG